MASNPTTIETMALDCHRCGNAFETEVLASAWGKLPMRCYCDGCFDLARTEWEAQQKAQRTVERRRVWLEDIANGSFDDTRRDLLPRPQLLDRLLEWKYGPRGLVIYGDSGRGKSRCMFALLERLYVQDEIPVRWIRVTSFARIVSNGGNEADALMRSLTRVPVLALDDLGKEAATERWESALVELLDARSMARRPVLITTNYVGAKLVMRFRDPQTGEAVVRRLREFCEPVSS